MKRGGGGGVQFMHNHNYLRLHLQFKCTHKLLPTRLRSDPLGEFKHSPDRRATADIHGMEYPLTLPSRSLEPLVAEEKNGR